MSTSRVVSGQPRRTSVQELRLISESATAAAIEADYRRLAQVTQRAAAPATELPYGDLLPARAQASGTLRRLHETALLLFAERGFHAVSVRDLTGALGLQPSSLYAHVTSKHDLLRDLVRLGHEEHRDQLRLALLDVGSDPGEQL